MGDLYMQFPNGDTLNIDADGNEVQGRIELNWCDKCDVWRPLAGGLYVQNQGLSIIWLCKECK